jgi:hypothetical protein
MGRIQAVLQRRAVFRQDIGPPIEDCDPPVQLQNARELSYDGSVVIELMPDICCENEIATGCR